MAERYEIIRKIGSGGVGAVYEAVDTFLERRVAIKRLLPVDESESPELAKGSLQKETAALSALQHPNIVTIYDVGEDEEGQFVVMELIDGENIEEAVEREVFTLEAFVEFAEQVLDALASAQSLDLLHRDIKPRNLMVHWGPGGKPLGKVLDFGLAKFAPAPALQTMDQNKAVLGSVFYMAPEQFERRPLDRRTDLYSLGSVLFYALTGHDPFDGDTAVAVMSAHLEHRVHHIREYRPDVPVALADWVMWLMNREMDDRPESADVALAVFTGLKRRNFDNDGSASVLAAGIDAAPPANFLPVASLPPRGRRALRSAATGSVIERDATTGLVPDVGSGQLTRPPAVSPPVVKVKRATGTTASQPGGTSTGLLTRSTTTTQGARPATAGTATLQGVPRPAPKAENRRTLMWVGICSAVALITMVVISLSGDDRPKDNSPDSAVEDAGEESEEGYTTWGVRSGGAGRGEGSTGSNQPVWVTMNPEIGGDDFFVKSNWFGDAVPEPGGTALIQKGTNRTIHRVNGPVQLTVAGKLNVDRYYDVIGFAGTDGGLKIKPGGEVNVGKKGGSKLVIGRLSSGWVEVSGKLDVAAEIEVGDTQGTVARLTVDGGEVRAPGLLTGDCKWEIEIKNGGKLLITGAADFSKGEGKVKVTDGGLLQAENTVGVTEAGTALIVERGGTVQLSEMKMKSSMDTWLKFEHAISSQPLQIKQVSEGGKTYLELSPKKK